MMNPIDTLNPLTIGAVQYSQFGAVGDGVTDDFDAIVAAHDYANAHHLPIKADVGATYYIGKTDKTAKIQTDVDWSGAVFLIDDSGILPGEGSGQTLFHVPSGSECVTVPGLQTLQKGQKKLDVSLGYDALVTVVDDTVRQYKRKAEYGNDGFPKSDSFLVDADGNILTDIIWDFDTITEVRSFRIEKPLTIQGGHFITKANVAPRVYAYYARNIVINRTNVTVKNLRHDVIDEKDEFGCPYMGFLIFCDSALIRLEDVHLTGHQVSTMGSYDLQINYSVSISLERVTQNDVNDEGKWGVMCTNFCKDFSMRDCVVSRFDAHMGVTNCTIQNCTLGYMTVHLIGHGVFRLEHSEIYGRYLIELRADYGSTFDGDLFITDCVWHATHFVPTMINAHNCGAHDFGYACTMPHHIVIDRLTVDDTLPIPDYRGLRVFNDYDNHRDGEKPYPYKITEQFVMRNFTVQSGRKAAMYGIPHLFDSIRFDLDEVSERNINWLDCHERY